MFTFLMVSIRTAYAEDNSPAYFGAVSIVVTIMLVLLCIWLLNSHNVTRKVKLSILGVGIGVFGLVKCYCLLVWSLIDVVFFLLMILRLCLR